MEKISDENINLLARVYGWTRIPAFGMLSYKRKKARMNIWHTKKGSITVGTALAHPTRGKTQLFRKNVDSRLLESIFDNPRVHTRLGYQVKRPTNTRRWHK